MELTLNGLASIWNWYISFRHPLDPGPVDVGGDVERVGLERHDGGDRRRNRVREGQLLHRLLSTASRRVSAICWPSWSAVRNAAIVRGYFFAHAFVTTYHPTGKFAVAP